MAFLRMVLGFRQHSFYKSTGPSLEGNNFYTFSKIFIKNKRN